MRFAVAYSIVSIALAAVSSPASGGLLFSDISGQSHTTGWSGSHNVGLQFTVGGSDILVDQLGVYVDSANVGDDVEDDVDVGIWKAGWDLNALVASVSIAAGDYTLTDDWAMVDVTAVTLEAGKSYRIAAWDAAGNGVVTAPYEGTAGSVDSGITLDVGGLGQKGWYATGGFTYPGSAWTSYRIFHANANVQAIPEPSSIVLTLSAAGLIAFRWRRWRKRQS